MDNKQYRQCHMTSTQEDGSKLHHTAFLPSEKAKLGKALDIELGGKWIKGFVIDFVGSTVTIDDVDKARENLKRFQWVLGE
jgi:hypothetical protein